jgi:hypothetical protein
MEYAVGKPGRIIAARLNEGEDLYQCIEKIAEDEKIDCAAVFITGGIRKANVVVGPKEEKPKIVGNFMEFTGPGEALGVGTIYRDDTGPKLHIHAAMGKGGNNIVGCPRGGCVFNSRSDNYRNQRHQGRPQIRPPTRPEPSQIWQLITFLI